MEQKAQEQTRVAKDPIQTEENRPREREKTQQAGQIAQAILAGVPAAGLPPSRLEELAGLVGNSGMAALLENQAHPPALTSFTPWTGAEDTAPSPVPDGAPALASAQGLTACAMTERAFEPSGLQL